MIAGDGTGDRLVARRVARVTPTWLPGPRYVLAFAKPNGSVNAVVADSGRKVFSRPPHGSDGPSVERRRQLDGGKAIGR